MIQLCSNYFIFQEFFNKYLTKLKESFKEKNLQGFERKHFYEGCSEGKKEYIQETPRRKKKSTKDPPKKKNSTRHHPRKKKFAGKNLTTSPPPRSLLVRP